MKHPLAARTRSVRSMCQRVLPLFLIVVALFFAAMPQTAYAATGASNPVQQAAALTGCENVPSGTLRIINYNASRTSVSGPGGRSITLAPGEVRDVPGAPGESWMGAHIFPNGIVRIRYVVPPSGVGCLIMGTPPPPPQLPDIAQCKDIPAGPYGTVTLRIVNFLPHTVYIRDPGLSNTYPLATNESRDFATSADLLWSYRDPSSTVIMAHRAAFSSVDCWVLGDPNAPTPTPVPLPDIPECKDIPDSVNGTTTLRIVNFNSYPMLIQEPDGSRWELGVGEVTEIDPVEPGGEWWAHPGIAGAVRWRYIVPTGGKGCFVIGVPGAALVATPPMPAASPTFDIPTPTATATEMPPATATPAASPTPLAEYFSLQSYNFPDSFARHSGFVYFIAPIESEIDRQDATFRVRPGLADPSLLSFESVNYPNYFVTVENGSVVLRERPAGDAAFDANSTFIRHPGLADPAGISLESYSTPGSYVRHSSRQLYVQPPDGSDLFNADATFYQVAPKWSSPAAPEATAAAPEATAAAPEATAAAPEATAAAPEATAAAPTEAPTLAPTVAPTEAPTIAPTATPTVAPTPTPTPVKSACTQEDFLKAVKDGEASGTVTLDGDCLYKLTSASDKWSGGSGAFLFRATTIEGNGATIERDPGAPNFRLLAVQAPNTVVRNLTLRNGASTGPGGGILFVNAGTLENVTFEANTSTDIGGAVAAQKTLVVRNVTIKESKGTRGGALFQYEGDLVLDNSRLINNQATDTGAAIYKQGGKLEITDTLFANNRAPGGAATALFMGGQGAPNARFYNNTITDNVRNPGTAIVTWSSLEVVNNIIANHELALMAGGKTTVVNEDFNLFVDNGRSSQASGGAVINGGANSVNAPNAQFVDAAALDYRLKRNSPAADRGSDAVLSQLGALAIDAANQPRPYSGTSVDIGAYELQDFGGASISIAKEGPHWFTSTVPVTFTLTVANAGVASGNNLVATDRLPEGATYIEGSATGGGVLVNGALVWQIPTLAPNAGLEFIYAVKGTQTLVSRDYGVSSSSDAYLAAQGKVITTTMNSNLVTKFSFFPNPDGYSFQNFSDVVQSDLTIQDMVRIFGADVACKVQSPSCVLTATAEAWRQKWLKFVEGGHCAGMAGGSLNIYVNPNVNASDFQTPADVTFDLTKENARRDITFWAVSQSDPPAISADLEAKGLKWKPATDPINVLSTLTTNLNDLTTSERYRVSISFRGGGGGHAMVPYAVERIKGDDYFIYVYDNNYPNDFTRAIKINGMTGVWSYVGTTNPAVPTSKYEGDKNTTNLSLVSLTWHTSLPKACSTLTCPPAASKAPAATTSAPAATGSLGDVFQVMLDGEANPLITRSDGAQVGYDPTTGEWINDIDGAVAIPLDLGMGLNIPPAIQIPYEAGMTYDVQVGPRETTFGNTEAIANLNVSGPGFAVAVTDLVVHSPIAVAAEAPAEGDDSAAETGADEAQADAPALDITGFTVDPEQKRIVVQPTGENGETPSISLAVSQPDGSDFNVTLHNVAIDSGNAIALGFDAESQSINIESNNGSENVYTVEVNRTTLDGTQTSFTSDSMADGGNAGVALNVGDEWDGESEPETEAITESTLPAPAGSDDATPAGEETAQQVVFCDASDVPASVNTDVMLRLVNASGADAVVYWNDGAGNLVEYGRIAVDGIYDQETWAGHEWVAMDDAGTVLLDYVASGDARQCVEVHAP